MTLLDRFRVQLDLKHWRICLASFLVLLWLPVFISFGEDLNGDGLDDATGDPVNGYGDPYTTDTDDDGLFDGYEVMGYSLDIYEFFPDELGYDEYEGVLGYWYVTPIMVWPDPYDYDTDDDLLSDGFEIENGYNPQDPNDGNSDDDEDGLTMGEEWVEGTNWNDDDSDDDGYLDGEEVLLLGSNPMDANDPGAGGGDPPVDPPVDPPSGGVDPLDNGGGTGLNFGDRDSDGIPDWWEFKYFGGTERVSAAGSEDDNGNGIPDGDEDNTGPSGQPGSVPDGIPDGDLDQDGLYNVEEFALGTDPWNLDSDDDGLDDGDEVNGIDRANSGGTETLFGNPLSSDSDGDGYLDGWEYAHGLDPQDGSDIGNDTDSDGLPDAFADYYAFLGTPIDPMGDADGDGLSNGLWTYVDGEATGEFMEGTDPFNEDTDGDGISDGTEVLGFSIQTFDTVWEESAQAWVDLPNPPLNVVTDPANFDTDGDGYGDGFEEGHGSDPTDVASRPILDYEDTDGDWLWNYQEAIIGTNGNLEDTDGDGFTDGEEYYLYGTDPMDPLDFWVDTDGDGISDQTEIRLGTDPNEADSDGDGFDDGVEVYWHQTDPLDDTHFWVDDDNDGLRDDTEGILGLQSNTRDSDGDGLSDGWEFYHGTNPNDASDAVDTDLDLIPDVWELAYGFNPGDDSDGIADADGVMPDADLDGLSNLEEFQNGTNPWFSDTDGDGLSDNEEVTLYLTNPNLWDTDGDGLGDGLELNQYGTDPLDSGSVIVDNDGDWIPDDWEAVNGLDDTNESDWQGDPDDDGLINWWEYVLGTDPQNNDSDGDTFLDGEEAVDGIEITDEDGNFIDWVWTDPALADTDSDGLDDNVEVAGVFLPAALITVYPSPVDDDSDDDSLLDGEEVNGIALIGGGTAFTDPTNPDSDDDGLDDGDEVDGVDIAGIGVVFPRPDNEDTDGDIMTDGWEVENGFDPTDPSDGEADENGDMLDSDGDGVSNRDEFILGTNPRVANGGGGGGGSGGGPVDSDGDGIDDATEIANGTNPNDPNDPGVELAPCHVPTPEELVAAGGYL